MIKYFCDICKREVKKDELVQTYIPGQEMPGNTWEVCGPCEVVVIKKKEEIKERLEIVKKRYNQEKEKIIEEIIGDMKK